MLHAPNLNQLTNQSFDYGQPMACEKFKTAGSQREEII
jgi:hypothetical protein